MASHDGESIDILLVEDNPGDVRLTREAFADLGIDDALHVVNDGEEALAFLHRRGDHEEAPRPDLILLDLNLPKVDGMEVLDEVKGHPELRLIPVVVLTGSESREDIVQSYDRHVNAYLTKPIDPEEFLGLVRSLESFWLSVVELPPSPQ